MYYVLRKLIESSRVKRTYSHGIRACVDIVPRSLAIALMGETSKSGNVQNSSRGEESEEHVSLTRIDDRKF